MKYLIIISVLAVVLVGGGVFLGMRVTSLSVQVSDLKLNYATLQGSYNNLQAGYNTLDIDYRTTLNNYNQLNDNYLTLQGSYDSLNRVNQSLTVRIGELETSYEILEKEYDNLNREVSLLRSENRELERDNDYLQGLVDEYESVPNSYYSTGTFKHYENTFEELGRFLASDFKLPRDYELNVFDCSESAAYLEWALENAGFWAEIVVGPDPSGEAGIDHAWVIAYTSDYKVAIEATALTTKDRYASLSWGRAPGVIYGEDNLIDYWENYYENYDKTFKNIYAAIRQFGTGQEWNWWEGSFGFE